MKSESYRGAADLRRMQASVARAYANTSLRVGDLAWLARHRTDHELALDIRLWESDDGQLAGWTFFRSNGGFNVSVAPGFGDDALFDEMLAIVDVAAHTSMAGRGGSVSLYTYGVDPSRSAEDQALAAALRRHGFRNVPSTAGVMTRGLDELPEPAVPAGYRLGWVETPKQIIARVEVQRAAFAPSDLTVEKYERVQRTWPHRPDLDRVVLTNDGAIVAFCTAWLDDQNAAGLLEPVGTHPAHQRRGLARAVCIDALWALRNAGAWTAQVGFDGEAAYALYRTIGFEPRGPELVFCRDPEGCSLTYETSVSTIRC